jgi:hypothetical protein
VNSININRAPLKEDVLQSAAEEEKEKKWYLLHSFSKNYKLQNDYVSLVTSQFIRDTVPKKRQEAMFFMIGPVLFLQ